MKPHMAFVLEDPMDARSFRPGDLARLQGVESS